MELIDYKGLENALKALNDLQEQYPDLMKNSTELIENINTNVLPDLRNLYLMAQNDDNVQRRMAGVLKECNRFLELFTIDRIRSFSPSLLMCVMRLQNVMAKLMEFAPTEEPTERPQELPDELKTDKAQQWLRVAIDGGLLNEDWTVTDKVKTKPQKALLAEILSEKIGITNKFVLFEKIWNVSNLAQKRWNSREQTGTVRGGKDIETVFN